MIPFRLELAIHFQRNYNHILATLRRHYSLYRPGPAPRKGVRSRCGARINSSLRLMATRKNFVMLIMSSRISATSRALLIRTVKIFLKENFLKINKLFLFGILILLPLLLGFFWTFYCFLLPLLRGVLWLLLCLGECFVTFMNVFRVTLARFVSFSAHLRGHFLLLWEI